MCEAVMDSKKMKVAEEGQAEASPEEVRAIIEPFSREDLQKILEEAAVRYGDVLDEVRKIADRDPANRKLFVRGLGADMSAQTFKTFFSQFGEMEDSTVVMDKATGKSKGYGFLTYTHMDSALRALREPMKIIDGRTTYCQLASDGPSNAADIFARKIYIGNVPFDADADNLYRMFAQYGDIENGPLGFDPKTRKCKGYAIFVYKTADGAKRALQEPIKAVDGHQLYCKYAIDKPQAPDTAHFSSLQPANALMPASSIYQNALAGAFNLDLQNSAINTSYTPSSLGNSYLNSPLDAASLGTHGLGAYGSAGSTLGNSLYGTKTSLQGAASHLSPAALRGSQAARIADPQYQSLYSSR